MEDIKRKLYVLICSNQLSIRTRLQSVQVHIFDEQHLRVDDTTINVALVAVVPRS